MRALQHLGLDVTGWDPVHFPEGERKSADVVLLTYVLNVIEDLSERRETLLRAWELTKSVLVVSARLRWERNQIQGTEYGDGILTQRHTFQHLYGAGELRDYVQGRQASELCRLLPASCTPSRTTRPVSVTWPVRTHLYRRERRRGCPAE
ncbi:hypothetical protein ACIRU3_38190 [Streptomyces sp. NPDC101151]|uniref:hypothetical protein n=1 Tax=Streptomyces sp. NPDC101151 TaxID=3366115 RepID=UPI00381A0989